MTRLAIFCDLGSTLGSGHLVRCTALGAAARKNGAEVTIAADFAAVPWALEHVTRAGLTPRQSNSPTHFARHAEVAVIDSYQATASELAGNTVPLAAIDDEALRPLPAQLVINQNLSATGCDYSGWPTQQILRGPRYALLLPQLQLARPAHYRERSWHRRPQRVLMMLGGTDASAAAVQLALRALQELQPIELKVIAANPHTATALAKLPVPTGSSLTPLAPVPAIESLMNWADLAVSAAGTTVWELCCLGVPMALVTVASNQIYHSACANDAGIAIALGSVREALETSWLSLRDVERCNEAGKRAFDTVDGAGAQRVARQVLGLALR